MSDADKAAMVQFFERVDNQGDVEFLDVLTAPEFVSHDRGARQATWSIDVPPALTSWPAVLRT